jgi:hypothetical protein
MAAAPSTAATTSLRHEILSPELALVDPELAAEARAYLADPARPLSSRDFERESPPVVVPAVEATPLPEDTIMEARRRLMERGLDAEVLESLLPSGKRFRRRATLIPATAAATAVGLFVLQLYLNQGSLG